MFKIENEKTDDEMSSEEELEEQVSSPLLQLTKRQQRLALILFDEDSESSMSENEDQDAETASCSN